MATVHYLGFWNFWFPIRLRGLRCIIRNFITIGRTAAEISHLTFFKLAAVHHLKFFKLIFWIFLRVRGANVRECAKSGEPLLKYSNLSIFSIWRLSAIFCGQILGQPTSQREFGYNRIIRFHNTKVWIFYCAFVLKTPICAPFWLWVK